MSQISPQNQKMTRAITKQKVLLAVYMHADEMLIGSWATNITLAESSRSSLWAVERAIRDLKQDGLIAVLNRHGVVNQKRYLVLVGEAGGATYLDYVDEQMRYYKRHPSKYRAWRRSTREQYERASRFIQVG